MIEITEQAFSALLPDIRGKLRFNSSLQSLCWFKVGGKAKAIFSPLDLEDLQYFLQNKPENWPIFTLGLGSNTLVRDGGFDGVIIKLGQAFTGIKTHDNCHITAGAAVPSVMLAKTTALHSIGGLEFLSGIPGTIGGNLAMNAGAYGSSISDVLVSLTAINYQGVIKTLSVHDMGYQYRGHSLNEKFIFLEGTFQGHQSTSQDIERKIADIQEKRQNTQPIYTKTSGSTFKNPLPHKAWELIDQAGCRGLRIGGAMVSEQHCNFFINVDNATANDLEELLITVQQKVRDTSGIILQPEIAIIGHKMQEDHNP